MQGIAPVLPNVNFGTDPLPDLYRHIDALRQAGRRVAPVSYMLRGVRSLPVAFDDLLPAKGNA